MFPPEIWEVVLSHMEVLALLKFKTVCKGWNTMITRLIETESKWYEKCVIEIPEDMWSCLMSHKTNPKICCDNFHEAKIHSEIWIDMYRSWIRWNALTRKSIVIRDIFSKVDILKYCAVTGSIVAVGGGGGMILFYDITESTGFPFYEVHHGEAIFDVILCRDGSNVMAVSYSILDIRYWNLQTKRKIQQTECRLAERIMKSHFNYCYSLGCDERTWTLNVERFVNGVVRFVRGITFTNPHYVVKAIGPGANQVILFMTSKDKGNRFFVSYPDDRFERISVHEEVHGEPGDMLYANNATFKIYKPCVATYIRHRGQSISISVSGREWKTYVTKEELCTDGAVSAILYHVGLLMIAIRFVCLRGAELRLYPIDDVNNLDKLDFKSMQFKTIEFTSPSLSDLHVTEFNSHDYLLAMAYRKIYIVKFE